MSVMEQSIVFFGAGPVAAQSLQLLAKNFIIEAVVTKQKPQGHRGDFPTLVKAKELGLTVHTPANKKELSALFASKPFSSTIGVVIDYGIIIAQDVIDYFPFGIINSHFSLLPQWRGADPITFSILSGQKTTGVSLMLITAGLDEGDLLSQTPVTIAQGATTDSLTTDLIEASDGALYVVLPLWLKGETNARPQEVVTMAPSKTPTYSRKLTKLDGLIDWTKSAVQIEREIRAYTGWPKSYTTLGGIDVVITKAHVFPSEDPTKNPGAILVIKEARTLAVQTGNGTLFIEKLKPAGKAQMDAASFINGYGKNL